VLRIPAVKKDIIIPDAMPPAVSIEKDFPGMKLFPALAIKMSLTKVYPDTRQKGISTRKV
jgi:hypothetical protein